MEYKSYQHIEKLGREECDGILNGTVTIQPKIDSTFYYGTWFRY